MHIYSPHGYYRLSDFRRKADLMLVNYFLKS
ncbi:MAG: hypothetical protein ACI8P9_004023, partial [Parasphingorhabdus sp.]